LASRLADVAQDVIDEAHTDADKLCAALAEAQQVTSTTQADYMVSLTKFRKSWIGKTIEGVKEAAQGFGLFSRNSSEEENQLTPGFVAKVKSAFDSPYQLTVLEICASLHVYSTPRSSRTTPRTPRSPRPSRWMMSSSRPSTRSAPAWRRAHRWPACRRKMVRGVSPNN